MITIFVNHTGHLTSSPSNLTKGHIASAHGWFIVFARWRQCATPPNTCYRPTESKS